jgi:hypothetical protein
MARIFNLTRSKGCIGSPQHTVGEQKLNSDAFGFFHSCDSSVIYIAPVTFEKYGALGGNHFEAVSY